MGLLLSNGTGRTGLPFYSFCSFCTKPCTLFGFLMTEKKMTTSISNEEYTVADIVMLSTFVQSAMTPEKSSSISREVQNFFIYDIFTKLF